MNDSARQRNSSVEEEGFRRTISASSQRSSGSERSGKSLGTFSATTAHTDYEYINPKFEYLQAPDSYDDDLTVYSSSSQRSPVVDGPNPRSSVETYASTVASFGDEDIAESTSADDTVELPHFQPQPYYDDSVPTTPSDFSKLFPSNRRLSISHDDSTPDGNMNLKVNTQVRTPKGRLQNMTLFHLRMYDLKNREFSLRRYDRDSGREVCHSLRKYQKTTDQQRPGFHRSLSNALSNLRTRSDNRMTTRSTPSPDQKPRVSTGFHENNGSGLRPQSAGCDVRSHPSIPTNTTRLEFSNYAQVEVKRRGTKTKKRYEFEYWGITYQWKRVISSDGRRMQTSFHLVRAGNSTPLAYVVPEPLSPMQQREEIEKGGWVPPCAMWISDESLLRMQNDVADVVVATGLIALVDDCVKRRFHNKTKAPHSRVTRLDALVRASTPTKHLMALTGRLTANASPHADHRPTPLRQHVSQ